MQVESGWGERFNFRQKVEIENGKLVAMKNQRGQAHLAVSEILVARLTACFEGMSLPGEVHGAGPAVIAGVAPAALSPALQGL